MRSRMVTLMLAVLTGAVAVAIVYFYVQRVEEQTTRGQEAVPVLVAGQSLPAGTTWADIVGSQLAEQQNIPERYVAPGALGGFQDLSRGVLAREVVAGEQLTSQAFAADAQTAFGSQFKAGTQVLSLPVERARAVAGHLA